MSDGRMDDGRMDEAALDEVASSKVASSDSNARPDIIVLSGDPDADDMAAVTAVIGGVLEELAAERGRQQETGQSAWEKSQRALRSPLHAGPGEWRGFRA